MSKIKTKTGYYIGFLSIINDEIKICLLRRQCTYSFSYISTFNNMKDKEAFKRNLRKCSVEELRFIKGLVMNIDKIHHIIDYKKILIENELPDIIKNSNEARFVDSIVIGFVQNLRNFIKNEKRDIIELLDSYMKKNTNKPEYVLPGGRKNDGEEAGLATAIRETQEELLGNKWYPDMNKMLVDEDKPLKIVNFSPEDRCEYILYVYPLLVNEEEVETDTVSLESYFHECAFVKISDIEAFNKGLSGLKDISFNDLIKNINGRKKVC